MSSLGGRLRVTGTRKVLSGPTQPRKIIVDQIADSLDCDVGGRVCRDGLGIKRVVPLARKDCRYPVPPVLFYRRKYSELVVYNNIVLGRVSQLDIRKHLFLVNIDQYPAFECLPQ